MWWIYQPGLLFSLWIHRAAVPQTRALVTIRGPWRGSRRSPDKKKKSNSTLKMSAQRSTCNIVIRGITLLHYQYDQLEKEDLLQSGEMMGLKSFLSLWKHFKNLWFHWADIHNPTDNTRHTYLNSNNTNMQETLLLLDSRRPVSKQQCSWHYVSWEVHGFE